MTAEGRHDQAAIWPGEIRKKMSHPLIAFSLPKVSMGRLHSSSVRQFSTIPSQLNAEKHPNYSCQPLPMMDRFDWNFMSISVPEGIMPLTVVLQLKFDISEKVKEMLRFGYVIVYVWKLRVRCRTLNLVCVIISGFPVYVIRCYVYTQCCQHIVNMNRTAYSILTWFTN